MKKNSKSSRLSRRAFVAGSAAVAGGAAIASTTGIRRARADLKKINFITPFSYLAGFAPVLNAAAGGHFERNGLDLPDGT